MHRPVAAAPKEAPEVVTELDEVLEESQAKAGSVE